MGGEKKQNPTGKCHLYPTVQRQYEAFHIDSILVWVNALCSLLQSANPIICPLLAPQTQSGDLGCTEVLPSCLAGIWFSNRLL